MPKSKKAKKSEGVKLPPISPKMRKTLSSQLKSFIEEDSIQIFEFPDSLSKEERAFVHNMCIKLGLKSHSKGKKENRVLSVMKTEAKFKKQAAKIVKLSQETVDAIATMKSDFPLTDFEKIDVSPLECSSTQNKNEQNHKDCVDRYNPGIPPEVSCKKYHKEREKLPISIQKSKILDLIAAHQVIMISGDTGSGKTTQVPQFILEESFAKKQPVRIICTQPRRIAAMSVAERVATERGEPLGGTVGYQIRLESRTSSKTLLTFCTTGILLRTLMYEDNGLENVTHLIIDEVHERDRFCDFLLGVIRSRLPRFPHIRLILMSAALDITVFSSFFENCPVLKVEGKCYPVTEFYLEDILVLTNHLGIADKVVPLSQESSEKTSKVSPTNTPQPWIVEPSVEAEMLDSLIQTSFIEADPSTFDSMMAAIHCQLMPLDYQHSQTSLTPLMVAAGRGRKDLVDKLLKLGANPSIKAGQWSALNLAQNLNHTSIASMLEEALERKKSSSSASVLTARIPDGKHVEAALKVYQTCWDEEIINYDLILHLLYLLEQEKLEGAVLIFLPGYEDIIALRDRMLHHDKRFASSNRLEIFMLHSSMQSRDQRRVFCRPPQGKRKVVLSTNLAETSITIDDIVYVIDTGKVKVKSYDTLNGVSALKAEWVSQASSLQRKGRAGRCRDGICFRLFSRSRYSEFEKFQVPEIVRVPLDELCLQSKYLAPKNVSIAEFIGQVPEAPSMLSIRRAVEMLQWMDALDPWENVTDLGRLLLDLPVEPRLGKMLLTATVLRCLDPVLSIVCCLSYRDPFILPVDSDEKKLFAARKLELTGGSLSDHMAMLRAFTLWTAARRRGNQWAFCRQYFLSHATMEIIHQLREQIRHQLRKSGFVRSFEELNVNAGNWAAIKASIVSGLYPQVARVNASSGKLATRRDPAVRLHTTSALLGEKVDGSGSQKKSLARLPSDWLVYQEMSRNGMTASVRCCTLISSITLAIFGGHCRLPEGALVRCQDVSERDIDVGDDASDSDSDDDIGCDVDQVLDEDVMKELEEGLDDLVLAERFCQTDLEPEVELMPKRKAPKKMPFWEVRIDDWLRLRLDKESAETLFFLRQKWQALFARHMRNPTHWESDGDDEILKCLLAVLMHEEEASGLPVPPDFTNESLHNVLSRGKERLVRNFCGTPRPKATQRPENRRINTVVSPRVLNWRNRESQERDTDAPKNRLSNQPNGSREVELLAKKADLSRTNRPFVNERVVKKKTGNLTADTFPTGDQIPFGSRQKSDGLVRPHIRKTVILNRDKVSTATARAKGTNSNPVSPRLGRSPDHNGPVSCQARQMPKKKFLEKNTFEQLEPQHSDPIPDKKSVFQLDSRPASSRTPEDATVKANKPPLLTKKKKKANMSMSTKQDEKKKNGKLAESQCPIPPPPPGPSENQ